MELILDLYSEEYGSKENPNTKEDLAYQKELMRLAEKYPIKTLKLTPDFEEDFEYIYYFETYKKLDYREIIKIEDELNMKMDEYGEQLGFKPTKYIIMEDFW